MPVHSPPELSAYELQRLERIAKNEERMRELQLPALAAAMVAPQRTPAVRPRGISAKRKRLSEPFAPPRRSSRLQGEPSDGAYVLDETRGTVTTTASERSVAADRAAAEAQPKERHPPGPVPFTSANAGTASDAAFLQLLERTGTATPASRGGSRAPATPAAAPGCEALAKLSLKDADVAKVVKQSVTHLAFMPRTDALILAAADKRGGVGLWHVDADGNAARQASHSEEAEEADAAAVATMDHHANEDSAEGDGGEDGVLVFAPHSEYISGLKWAGGSGAGAAKLFTAAYDGSVRRLDAERSVFTLAWGDEEMEYSCMEVSPDGATCWLGDKDGDLDIVDLRAGKRVNAKPLQLHNRKLNTLHVDPGAGHLLVTSSTDAQVKLFDTRKLSAASHKAVASAAHTQGCQAACLSPDGSLKVLSTSFDNTLRVWDGKRGMEEVLKVKHDNATGRWILPFRAVWSAAGDALIVGNMKRAVDVIDAADGTMAAQLRGEGMTAIAARNCVHPTLPVLAAGTASGRLHIYR